MKAYLSIDVTEDCPQENSGAYAILVFRCSTCGTELIKPRMNLSQLKQSIEDRMKDQRNFADLWHPDPEPPGRISCEYTGKYFDGPLVELREVTGE
jgi:hypothetical protein